MDGLLAQPIPQPSVEIVKEPFFSTPKGKIVIIIGAVILLVVISVLLKYFKIFSAPAPQTTQTPPPTPEKLTLSCPVPRKDCTKAQNTQYNGNPAVIFDLPTNTTILSVAPVVDLSSFNITNKGLIQKKGLRQTSILLSSCYTFTYLLPKDVVIKKIDLLPLDQGEILATASGSLILQIQMRSLDPATQNQPDFKRCPAIQDPDSIGEFPPIDPSIFQ